jgi:hypothetical protein
MRSDIGLVDTTNDGPKVGNQRLKRYLESKRIGYDTGLNILQAHGVVSDCAEYIEDVYGPDQVKAIAWMKVNVWRDRNDRLKVKTDL